MNVLQLIYLGCLVLGPSDFMLSWGTTDFMISKILGFSKKTIKKRSFVSPSRNFSGFWHFVQNYCCTYNHTDRRLHLGVFYNLSFLFFFLLQSSNWWCWSCYLLFRRECWVSFKTAKKWSWGYCITAFTTWYWHISPKTSSDYVSLFDFLYR